MLIQKVTLANLMAMRNDGGRIWPGAQYQRPSFIELEQHVKQTLTMSGDGNKNPSL